MKNSTGQTLVDGAFPAGGRPLPAIARRAAPASLLLGLLLMVPAASAGARAHAPTCDGHRPTLVFHERHKQKRHKVRKKAHRVERAARDLPFHEPSLQKALPHVPTKFRGTRHRDVILMTGFKRATVNGRGGNDLICARRGNYKLIGGAGNDTLIAGSGRDSLDGNAGNDTLAGGPGNDLLNGGPGTDTVDYSSSGAGVVADLATGSASGQGADTLTADENLTGSSHDDSLSGDGADNSLDGNAGNDTLAGGPGNDLLNGGPGTDTVDYSSSGAGVGRRPRHRLRQRPGRRHPDRG